MRVQGIDIDVLRRNGRGIASVLSVTTYVSSIDVAFVAHVCQWSSPAVQDPACRLLNCPSTCPGASSDARNISLTLACLIDRTSMMMQFGHRVSANARLTNQSCSWTAIDNHSSCLEPSDCPDSNLLIPSRLFLQLLHSLELPIPPTTTHSSTPP